MTDEAAILAAVLHRYDDDTPRLVYADWLDDHPGYRPCDWCDGSGSDRRPPSFEANGKRYVYTGPDGPCPKCKGDRVVGDGRQEQAAFIRLQVEVERLVIRRAWLPSGTYSDEVRTGDAARYRELRSQEKEWWFWKSPIAFANRNGLGPVDSATPCTATIVRGDRIVGVVFFVRGFVRSVVADADDWRYHGDSIVAGHPVRGVRLTTTPPEFSPDFGNAGEWGVVQWYSQARGFFRTDRWPGVDFFLPASGRDFGFAVAGEGAILVPSRVMYRDFVPEPARA